MTLRRLAAGLALAAALFGAGCEKCFHRPPCGAAAPPCGCAGPAGPVGPAPISPGPAPGIPPVGAPVGP
jgi:hypothetical protein